MSSAIRGHAPLRWRIAVFGKQTAQNVGTLVASLPMGIRFHCPNGHKLNVKAFLAGKRAICPKCGTKVVVPLVSESEEVLAEEGKPIAGSTILTQAPASAIGSAASKAVTTKPVTAHVATTSSRDAAGVPGDVTIVRAETSPTAATSPPSSAPGPNGAPHSDPIDEAPTAVWYVRPPGGGQYGPAAASVMRIWLAEGRVGVTSLVWRAGWPEWRNAADVFPQLATGPASAAPMSVAPVVPVATPVGSPLGGDFPFGESAQATSAPLLGVGGDVVSMRRHRRKRSNNVTIIASVVLVAVAIVLVAVLIYVLNSQGATA